MVIIMENKLVSIVSPCYNGESYIARFLDSIIAQTYRPLELILVNDNSTDNTDDIVRSYSDKLAKNGIDFKYHMKKVNGGPGGAINDGLKLMTGEYLIWPDTDDFLYPNSIEERVNFLKKHPEFGFVQSDGAVYDEYDIKTPKKKVTAIIPKNGEVFKNVLSGDIVYTPCGYMLRTSAFLDVNPNKEIYPSRYGQNIQMLMPIAYKYKCGYLKETLYGRVDRNDSLSKRVWNENDDAWKNRVLGLEEIYVETLKSIGGDALAYIPYIYYRDLRILNAVSKKVGTDAHRKQKSILKDATMLLLKEITKTFIKRN